MVWRNTERATPVDYGPHGPGNGRPSWSFGLRRPFVNSTSDEYDGLLAATSRRLRLLQVDFAGQGDAARRQSLAEEIGRALTTVPPQKRREFLEMLGQQFPTWDTKIEPLPPKPPPPPVFDERN